MSPIPSQDGAGSPGTAQAGATTPEPTYTGPQVQSSTFQTPEQAIDEPKPELQTSEDRSGNHRPAQDVPGQPGPAQETDKPAPEKRYSLTIEAAAEIYDQNEVPRDLSTIRKYCRQGKIEAARLPDENGAWFITEISVHRHARKLKDELWIAREREAQTKGQTDAPLLSPKTQEHAEQTEVESIDQPQSQADVAAQDNLIKIAKLEVKVESLNERLFEKDEERKRQKEIYEAQLDRNERTLQIAYRENGELKTLLAKAGIQVGQLTVNNHPDQNPLPGIEYKTAEGAHLE